MRVNIITIKCRVQLLPVFDDSPGLDFNLHVLLFGATKCATGRRERKLNIRVVASVVIGYDYHSLFMSGERVSDMLINLRDALP